MTRLTPYTLVSKKMIDDSELANKISANSNDNSEYLFTYLMKIAVDKLAEYAALDKLEANRLEKAVFGENDKFVSNDSLIDCKFMAHKFQEVENKEDMVFCVMSALHDTWIESNAKSINESKSKQLKERCLPIEMLGWDDAKVYISFIDPIIKLFGVSAEFLNVEEYYDQCVVDFYNRHGYIDKKGKLSDDGAKLLVEFYLPLSGVKSFKNIVDGLSARITEEFNNKGHKSLATV